MIRVRAWINQEPGVRQSVCVGSRIASLVTTARVSKIYVFEIRAVVAMAMASTGENIQISRQ